MVYEMYVRIFPIIDLAFSKLQKQVDYTRI